VYTNTLSKSVATLGNVEENDSISRALARLSEVEEKVEDLHNDQVRFGGERGHAARTCRSLHEWEGQYGKMVY